MKLKKFFAAVLAGAVALSSFSLSAWAASSDLGTSVTASADDTSEVGKWIDSGNGVIKYKSAAKGGDSSTDEYNAVAPGSTEADIESLLPAGKTLADIRKITATVDIASGATGGSIGTSIVQSGDPNYKWAQSTIASGKAEIESPLGVCTGNKLKIQLDWINYSTDVTITVKLTVDGVEEPGDEAKTYEIPFDTKKDIVLTKGDKDAGVQISAAVDGITTGKTTYGDLKKSKIKMTGLDLTAFTLPEGIKESDVNVQFYTMWGTAYSWKDCSAKETWDLSKITGVADTDVLQQVGYQIYVTGENSVVAKMKKDEKLTLKLQTGTENPDPEEPGDKDEYVKIELETGISTGAELKPGGFGSTGSAIMVPTDKVDVKAIKKIVVAVDETKVTTDYFKGKIGYNDGVGTWTASEDFEYPKTKTWEYTFKNGIKDGLQLQFDWINKVQDGTNTPGTAAIKSVTLYGDGDKVLAVAEPKAAVAPNPDDGKDQTVDLVFDPTKDIEFTVVDASSWSAGAYTKAAQANVSIEIKGVTDVENTFKALKNTKVKFSGYDLSHYAFPDGIKGGNVSVSLFAKWVNKENPDKDSKWTASYNVNSTWALSSLKDVPDDYILDSIGCQLNINGTVAAVNSMNIGDKFTIKYDSTIVPEIDTSGWQIAVFGFGEGWKSKWSASKPNSGVLTFTDTIGNIMKNDGVEGEIGGLQIQVWNVPDKQDVSYSIVIKTGAGASYVNLTGTHTVSPTDTGFDYTLEQLCTGICWGDYIFKDDYVITVNVLPGKDKFKTESSDNTGASGVPIGTVTNGNTTSSDNKPEETVKVENGNNDTGATVNAPKGAFDKPEEVKFNAAPVAEETKDDKFTFDLNFTDKDGKEIQPKSAVTVSIPLPTALKDAKTVFVYHIEADGTYTEVSCKIENGMVVFSAKNFSKYVISGKKLDSKGEPAADQPATSDPATSDTTSGTSDTTPGTSGTTSGGTTTTEPNANTGAGGMAVILGFAALAAGALIVSKKRK